MWNVEWIIQTELKWHQSEAKSEACLCDEKTAKNDGLPPFITIPFPT